MTREAKLSALLRVVIVVWVSLQSSTAVGAQAVSGRILREDSLTPVSGALITAIDRAGRIVARSVSSSAGRYILRLPAGGDYGIRARHIGSEPVELSDVDVAPEATIVRDIILNQIPVDLAPLIAQSTDQCGVPSTEAAELIRYWDRTRKVIASAESAAVASDLSGRFAVVNGSMDIDRTHVIVDAADVREAIWHAGSGPGTLLRSGYGIREISLANATLPVELVDPAVILTDDFARRHCYRLDWKKRGEGMVGIRFSPMHERDSTDLAGTVWVDTATATVRVLDFHFAGLPAPGRICSEVERQRVPGCVVERQLPDVSGQIEFAQLPTGECIAQQWQIQFAPDSVVLRTVHAIGPPPPNIAPAAAGNRIGHFVLRFRTSRGALAAIRRDGDERVFADDAMRLLRRRP